MGLFHHMMFHHRPRRYIKATPTEQLSKSTMIITTVIMGIIGVALIANLPSPAALGVFVGLGLVILVQWMKWSQRR